LFQQIGVEPVTEGKRPPFGEQLIGADPSKPDDLLDRFLAVTADRGLVLYPAQEEAVLEILSGKHIVLNTPTGSGKSLVATALAFWTLANGGRLFYTCPIKALVSEKFFTFCEDFGADEVGMLTGDASINRDAPIICCTAEILMNMALRMGEACQVDAVVMDEFHYYADRDRGVAWEVPLIALPHCRFLLMSATLGDPEPIAKRLEALTKRPAALVRHAERPVPLDFEYREKPQHETIRTLVEENRAPVYMVNFTQRACAEEAQNLMSENYCSREEKAAIHAALADFSFDTPYGKEVQKFVRHGVGLHHAGLLPKYRLLVEKLSQRGHLKVICGTDTLGVGVNIPIRTVLFTKLCKFDGEKVGILRVREFHQIAGRAGRKGFDDRGSVWVQAPAHAIENIKIDGKKALDPKKFKKLVRQKPPNKGYVHYDRSTFDRLVGGTPEALVCRFDVTHGMMVHVLHDSAAGRRGGYGRLLDLIARANLSDRDKRKQRLSACQVFRSLRRAGLLELTPRPPGMDGRPRRGSTVSFDSGLQEDFSLNQTLSLYLLEAVDVLDPEHPDYALDLLSFVEAILENPTAVLRQQLNKKKGEVIAELKANGVEYDDRMEALERVEIDKPNAELIYETFNEFAKHHPWVAQENIRPKSIARAMVERYQTFLEMVREDELHRVEGLLLRYLTDVYKTLVQSVPEERKTQEVDDIIEFIAHQLRHVDSSLIDEWEALAAGKSRLGEAQPTKSAGPLDLADDPKALTVRVRRELHRLLKALSARDWAGAVACLRPDTEWTEERIESAMAPYYDAHIELLVHHQARTAEYTHMTQRGPRRWDAWQTMVDPEGDNDWVTEVTLDLRDAPVVDESLIELVRIGA